MMRAAILALLLLALPAAWGAAGVEPVRLAVIQARSGPLATSLMRQYTAAGATLAVEDINAGGGLLGRPVELVEYDSGSTALGARTAARQAILLRPVAVIGERASTMSLVIAPMLQQAGIPMITPSSTHPDITRAGDYIFRVCFTDTFQGAALADFARRDLKARRVAVLTNASLKNSVELSRRFIERFRSQGGEVLLELDYVSDTRKFDAIIGKLQALAPDLLFIPGGPEDSAALMRQARALGLKTPFLGGDAWNEDMYVLAGAAIEGAYSAVHWHASMPGEASNRFVRRFELRYGRPRGHGEALSYDAVMLLANAARRAGSLEPADLRAALASTSALAAVTGTISMDAERNPIKPVVVVRHQGGKASFVKAVTP